MHLVQGKFCILAQIVSYAVAFFLFVTEECGLKEMIY